MAKFGSGVSPKPNLLDVRDVCKQFPGVKALDGVEMQVRKGEVHALLGPGVVVDLDTPEAWNDAERRLAKRHSHA